jgi:hypothetical protein
MFLTDDKRAICFLLTTSEQDARTTKIGENNPCLLPERIVLILCWWLLCRIATTPSLKALSSKAFAKKTRLFVLYGLEFSTKVIQQWF